MGVNLTSRRFQVSINNGIDSAVFETINPLSSQTSNLDPSGLIVTTLTFELTQTPQTPETLDPWLSTTGRWNIGNRVDITFAPEDDSGLVPHPVWTNLRILKVPYFDKTYGTLKVEAGCTLTFFNTPEPDDDKSDVDPAVAAPRNVLIRNLLIASGVPATQIDLSAGPTDEIRYPIQKVGGESFVAQGASLAYNAPAGRYFLYANAGVVQAIQYAAAIATPIEINWRDLPRRPERVQPDEYVKPVEILKTTGTQVTVNDCADGCSVINEEYITVKEHNKVYQIHPLANEPYLVNRTTVCRDLDGDTLTETQTEEATESLSLNPADWQERVTATSSTITVFNDDGLAISRSERQHLSRALFREDTQEVTRWELYGSSGERKKYTYDDDKFINTLQTIYERAVVKTGLPPGLALFEPKVHLFLQDPVLADLGADVETYTESECGLRRSVSNGALDGTVTIGNTGYLLHFESPKKKGTTDVDGPPQAIRKPLPYGVKEKQLKSEATIAPINGGTYATREITVGLGHVHDQATLDNITQWLANLRWQRAYGFAFLLPWLDRYMLSGNYQPIMKIRYTDEDNLVWDFLWEAPQFAIDINSAAIEIEMPRIARVGVGVVPSPWQSVFSAEIRAQAQPAIAAFEIEVIDVAANAVTTQDDQAITTQAGEELVTNP